jgi:hypothetical protein
MPLTLRAAYDQILYTLPQTYSQIIASSTVRLYTTSASTAKVEGDIYFVNGLRLHIRDIVDFGQGLIRDYSYTVYRGDEKICWYDPQPHPENPALASTFPHHRHEPPDIKHNRKPAPGISFHAPNLPTLIADCETLGKTLQSG